MNRILVVVFENESKADEGVKALEELDRRDSITVYRHAVVVKNADSTMAVREWDDLGPFNRVLGTTLGIFLGALGGLAGVAVGATVGLAAGGVADLKNTRVGEDFIDDVAKALEPKRAAVVADIGETSTDVVDTRMEAIGGITFRRTLSEVKHTIHQEHIAAIKADLAQMKAELAQAHAERKAKLLEKINQLNSKLQSYLQKAKERREAEEREARAKVELLQAKAAAAKAKAEKTHNQL